MIKINFYKNGLIVSGHAEFAEHGKDVVCAGVSAIVLGALNWFIDSTAEFEYDEGYVYLKIDVTDSKQIEYLNLLNTQLSAINHEPYNSFISFNEHKTNLPKER